MSRFSPPIQDRAIRVALVGCGRIAKNHFAALERFRDRAELVAVCDVDPAALSAAQKQHGGARGYASLTALLGGSDADVVVLATPSGLHPEQAIQIAAAGRNVITEKPMATRWSDGKRMVQACDAAGVRLFVVKQNRYNSTLQLAKRAVEQGRFGRIYMVAVNVFWTRPQAYFDSAKWRGTWEFDGGAFMNQASHYVDLLDWLIGPVESVYAYTATLARSIEVEDTGVAAVRWRTGALGSVNVTMLTYPKNLEGSITIIGEKGTVRVGGVAVNEITHWEFAEPSPDDELAKTASYATGSVYGFGHAAYYDNVIKVLRGEAEPQTDGREGLRSLELLIAIYRSARDGTRTSLPLEGLTVDSPAARYWAHETAIVDDGAQIGAGTKIWHWTHVCAGARIGANCTLSQNVFIADRAVIGDNVSLQNNVSIFNGVILEDKVFCGPNMVFTNVVNPRAHVSRRGEFRQTLVRRGATIGANATVVCGHTIGEYAFVGAGAVVTKDVPPHALVLGNPARHAGWMCQCGERLPRGTSVACARCGSRYALDERACTPLPK